MSINSFLKLGKSFSNCDMQSLEGRYLKPVVVQHLQIHGSIIICTSYNFIYCPKDFLLSRIELGGELRLVKHFSELVLLESSDLH